MTSPFLNLDPAATAEMVRDWIALRVPSDIRPWLSEAMEQWRGANNLPPAALWRGLIDRLHHCGCFDAEIEACRLLLAQAPKESFFRLRLAEMLRRSGKAEEAKQVLLDGMEAETLDKLGSEILLQRLVLANDGPAVDALETLLLTDGEWGACQQGLIDHFVKAGAIERAAAFITHWTGRWRIKPAQLFDMGVVAMQIGRPQLARSFFTPIWAAMANVIGQFNGTIRPYDDAVEARLTARIDAAFADDEAALAVTAPPDFGSPPSGLKVMMLSYDHHAVSNDMADHFSASAAEAGVAITLYLDNALITPADFPGTDQEVAERVDAFAAKLDQERPDILIIDCCAPLILRGINPGIAADLKARYNFRLVCVMRDAQRGTEPLLDAWLPACDTMVVFDPLSPVFSPTRAPMNHKVITLPVPSLHPPFLERCNQDLGLTFAGNIVWQPRYALLSVLMSEDIRFTAVFGPRRAVETPDTASYARLLSRSQAILNVSHHGPGISLVTGRVWESIAAGTLLVEQDNPATAMFFTPYRHYLPWKTVEDIVHIARFVERRPDMAAKIASEAHAWAKRHYNAKRFWEGLLGHVTRSLPKELTECDAVHGWVKTALLSGGLPLASSA